MSSFLRTRSASSVSGATEMSGLSLRSATRTPTLHLESIDCHVAVATIYEKVELNL
jgi:hypothetical protein